MILRFDPAAEFATAEDCRIVEISNGPADPGCSIARARVAPGVTTRLHRLATTIERYVILEGEGEVEVAGAAPALVRPLDVVLIPAGAAQRITNVGDDDLVFLCVCTPRFTADDYAEVPAA